MAETGANIEIGTFRSKHAERFAGLNRAWLERYNLMEPAEKERLAHPQRYFVECGGQIFAALHDERVIGTCAIIPYGVEEFELAKLAVAPEFARRGVARRP